MGGFTSKEETISVKETSSKGRRLNRKERDEREKVMFDQWRKERKKLRDEVKRLRKKVEEREEVKIKTREEREYWKWVVEEMCVERVVRDEAIEKWKQLYLAIKNELDHLIIHTTSSGEAIMERKHEKGQEDEEETKTVEELRDEVKFKEKAIETLKERLALMGREKYEKEREIDLLRQSLRILGSNKKKKKGGTFESINLLILKTKCVECT